MTIHYPKFVKVAGQWVITIVAKDNKGAYKQEEHWFSTEAVAVAEYKRLTEKP